ncbi:MAG: FKBP-type peptidyl-prolyl cis-trans isomerase, partial [Xanthomonadales bacterium]|nr:FKBP-type peptidyl-prolyl cis-trans isomerase [Xanthomonadales bacterium]
LAENRSKKGVVVLPSGIQYRVIDEGNGARPTPTSEVEVHYRGSLVSGFEFDSSFARNQPATFKIDQVLKGWQEVLPLMRVGDQWQVFLPPEMAYGDKGPRPIGPNQALIFDIKLISIK